MVPIFEANRMSAIPFSDIRSVFEKVTLLENAGRKIYPFHIGQPDFDTPEHIKQAAKDALDRGVTSYSSNYGLPSLRQAVAEKLARDNGVYVDPESQIIITVGSNEAILMAMMAVLNPGDEVLIPDPIWLHYFYCAHLAGAKPVSVPLRAENGFQIDMDDLKKRVTPNTKMLLLNSPHNPTGAVFSPETVRAIAEFVIDHNLVLLSDEIYEKMIYGEQKHLSPASIAEVKERTITINGFSKAYAMTGWRVGYVAASQQLTSAMIRVHQYTTICATSFAQAGALAALQGPQDCVREMMLEFEKRRATVLEGLRQIPGVSVVTPMGAFYAFPDIRSLGDCSEEVANQLLNECGIAAIPGKAFGSFGEGYLRISFACSFPQVQEGMETWLSLRKQNYCV